MTPNERIKRMQRIQRVEDMADALLTTHIRFVGFQGNPRQTTRPISFDEQALGRIVGPRWVRHRRAELKTYTMDGLPTRESYPGIVVMPGMGRRHPSARRTASSRPGTRLRCGPAWRAWLPH